MTIDFHMIHYNEPSKWVDQIKNHVEAFGYNLHVIPGKEGNTALTRAEGFGRGDSDYVSFVDPDDLIDLSQLPPYQNHQACYTNSIRRTNVRDYRMYRHREWTWRWHIQQRLPVHQLTIINREVLNQALFYAQQCDLFKQLPVHTDQLLYGYVAYVTPWVFYRDHYPYTWIQHKTGTHKQVTSHIKNAICDHIRTLQPTWKN